jgi:2-polyprenyl-3-methyl-5-hydroxy-6-metoxy-1,4-benzoquinol methylase
MPQFLHRSWEMDERSWWDLWNSSFRSEEGRDETSTELFSHVTATFRDITRARHCRVLEVACGTGTLSRNLMCSSYHGLDLSSAAIAIARQRAATIVTAREMNQPVYETADFHEWPLPAEQFDLVVCVDAISCFRDQSLVMRKIFRSLRVGGHVLMTTVNPFVYDRIRRADGGRLQNGPVSHWLSRGELHRLIEQAGLEVERSYTIMPRGNLGILRIINSGRLNRALGSRGAAIFRLLKENCGLGQYRVVVAGKSGPA